MLAHLHTWRFGQDTSLVLHGETIRYQPDTQQITVERPVLADGTVGIQQIWTLLNTDDLLLLACKETCEISAHKY